MASEPMFMGTEQQVLNNMIGGTFWWYLIFNACRFVTHEVLPFWDRLKADKRRYDFVRSFDVELDW